MRPSAPVTSPSSPRHRMTKARRCRAVIAGAAVAALLCAGGAALARTGYPSPARADGSALAVPSLPAVAGGSTAPGASPGADTRVTPAGGAVTLLSQGMPATASSDQDPRYYPASAAVDGDPGTRWSSGWSDPQWLKVDLRARDKITKVVLDWEDAYAKAFKIQTSRNGRTWTTLYSTAAGTGGIQALNVTGTGRYVRMHGTARATGYGYSLWELRVYGVPGPMPMPSGMPTPVPAPPFSPNLDPGQSITVSPPVPGIIPGQNFVYPSYVSHYEFQTGCSVTRDLPDDPIVYPRMPGASHMHSFMGATANAFSTSASLARSGTSCVIPQDHSAYWFPALFNGSAPVMPTGPEVIYYKSGIYDYRTVRPFPPGLRFVVGDHMATEAQFQQARGTVEGWECGNSYLNWNFPTNCPPGSDLVIRYQAPSCWDGVHLDSPDHQSHMAYPIHIDGKLACPPSHPVAVPMLEFKIAFPVSGDLSHLHLASGPGYTWHYDFFNGWHPAVLAALVKHCINQGLQCDTHGYDQYQPRFGAVLGPDYQLLPGNG
jgi:hypothetical protein